VYDDDGEETVAKEKHFRMRRGELVEIPEKWVGKVAHPQSKRKRPSKLTRKARNGNQIRHRHSLTIDMLKHKQGDYLDDEEQD